MPDGDVVASVKFVRSVWGELGKLLGDNGTKLDVALMILEQQVSGKAPTVMEVVSGDLGPERTVRRATRSMRDKGLLVAVEGEDRRTVRLQFGDRAFRTLFSALAR